MAMGLVKAVRDALREKHSSMATNAWSLEDMLWRSGDRYWTTMAKTAIRVMETHRRADRG